MTLTVLCGKVQIQTRVIEVLTTLLGVIWVVMLVPQMTSSKNLGTSVTGNLIAIHSELMSELFQSTCWYIMVRSKPSETLNYL